VLQTINTKTLSAIQRKNSIPNNKIGRWTRRSFPPDCTVIHPYIHKEKVLWKKKWERDVGNTEIS
jgi:hypothetical protein